MQEPVSTMSAAGSFSLSGRRSSFPPSCLKKLFCEKWILTERKIWVLWQYKCRSLSDGGAWPPPGSWWFHILTKCDYPRGPWNWSIRILKIFVMPRCFFSRTELPTEGWSKSHSKSHEIILYRNMCTAHVVAETSLWFMSWKEIFWLSVFSRFTEQNNALLDIF